MIKIENKGRVRLGLISDTHGLFRPEVRALFKGVDYILHAGDIGKPAVLQELQKIAPVTAVTGNLDIAAWFPQCEKNEIIEAAGKRIFILHDLNDLDIDPVTAEIGAVIHGHTHKPSVRQRKSVWYINPGSAGPHRFMLPVSVAVMEVGEQMTMRHYTIKDKR